MVAACSSSSTTVTSPTSARCPVQLTQTPSTIDAGGGSGQIAIAVNRECTWEARSEADWITLAAPTSGQGEANLGYSVVANPAVSIRRGAVVVNDQRIEVAQSAAACRYTLSAPGGGMTAAGGGMTVTVSAQPSCRWTAVSQVDWVRVETGREGDGQGAVAMSVAPNAGPAREGAVVVAGQTFSVSQSAASGPVPQPGCEFTVAPASESFAATGGEGLVRVVAAGPACVWTAASNVPWITVTLAGGSGPGAVRYAVAANNGAARAGILTVATSIVTVTQAAAATPGCELTISPQTESFPVAGGEGTVRVTASGPSCNWSAASSVSWLTVATNGGSGSGNVRYTVAANTGTARTGNLSVAGNTVSVTQAAVAACEYDVSPSSESFPAGGGDGSIRVRAASSCSWTASSNASWLSVPTGSGSGNGNGNARYVVASNTGAARTGTLSVAGATVTVTQAAAATCEYDVSPTSESFPSNGGEGSVRIRTSDACAWSAVPSVSWITVTAGSGSGNGNARYSVASNTGAARTGTVAVGGAAVTINQEAVPPPNSVTLSGEVENLSGQCPNLTFGLDRRLVRTNSSTRFDERCDHLRNRRDATVWGTFQSDGSVLAQRVDRR